MIPPNIDFIKPNPKIYPRAPAVGLPYGIVPFQRGKLEVPVEAIPSPKERHARVSVNSFGIGGANAHVSTTGEASIFD